MEQRGIAGAVLIAVGVVLLIALQSGVGGEIVVAAIGVGFLVGYALRRHYAFLVPGGILTGLGIGIVFETRYGGGAAVLLGLGAGFLSIYVIDAPARQRMGGWWPLIPGGILTVIGLALAAGQSGLLQAVGRWWPAILIIIGVYVLLRRRGEKPPAG